jgi:hypothetical protein
MKKYIPLILLTLISVCSFGQTWTTINNYQKPLGVWVTGIFRLPSDTTSNKSGVASLSGVIYSGNGTYWQQVGKDYFAGFGTTLSGTTFGVDSLVFTSWASRKKLADSLGVIIATKGSGTVTSIAAGYGISGGTITTTGTHSVDTTKILYKDTTKVQALGFNINGGICLDSLRIRTNAANGPEYIIKQWVSGGGIRLGFFMHNESPVFRREELEAFIGSGSTVHSVGHYTNGDGHAAGFAWHDRRDSTRLRMFGVYSANGLGALAFNNQYAFTGESYDTSAYPYNRVIAQYDSIGNIIQYQPTGSFTTYGLDKYAINLASSYTARSKVDKNYVDSSIALKGSGTVTSVATGLGLSGGTITSSGTLIADTSYLVTKSSTQQITGKKTFSDTATFGGVVNYENGQIVSGGGVSATILAGGTASVASVSIVKNTSTYLIVDITFTATPQSSGLNNVIRFDFTTPLSNTPYVTASTAGIVNGSTLQIGGTNSFNPVYDLTTTSSFTVFLNGNFSTQANLTRRVIYTIIQ